MTQVNLKLTICVLTFYVNLQTQSEIEASISVFHQVEGLALVMLCNFRLYPRRLAIHILREIKCLFKLLG